MTIQIYALETRHEKALQKLSEGLITPSQFLANYPGCTYKVLSKICHCSEPTVKRWLCNGRYHREPAIHHKLWLTLAHHTIQRIERERRQ